MFCVASSFDRSVDAFCTSSHKEHVLKKLQFVGNTNHYPKIRRGRSCSPNSQSPKITIVEAKNLTFIENKTQLFTIIEENAHIFTAIENFAPVFTTIEENGHVFTTIENFSPVFTIIEENTPFFTNIERLALRLLII